LFNAIGFSYIQNRKLIYANKALADITGHTKDELLSISPEISSLWFIPKTETMVKKFNLSAA